MIQMLGDLLSDGNPAVVSNSVAALEEITKITGREHLHTHHEVMQLLLAAVNEVQENILF